MQYRDLSIEKVADEYIVVACDSSSGIGEKEHDVLTVPSLVMSAHCIRVPLMELLSIGAEPFLVVNVSGNEMNPTTKKYIQGIRNELIKAGYPELPMNGSTEENMETSMSSLGVTVLGRATSNQMKWRSVQAGDIIYQIGLPYVGEELISHFDDIVSYDDIKLLHQLRHSITEIVPVGSKGSWNEAEQLAQVNKLKFKKVLNNNLKAMCEKSAGPSTTIIVSASPNIESKLREYFKHVFIIGEMEELDE
ncbi:hypothetical protein ACF3NG_01280 [Aerococcaceae bacterium WGS1372]